MQSPTVEFGLTAERLQSCDATNAKRQVSLPWHLSHVSTRRKTSFFVPCVPVLVLVLVPILSLSSVHMAYLQTRL